MRIAFATSSGYPDLHPDDLLAVPALAARGLSVVPAVWDDPGFDWSACAAVIVRSTWDYTSAPAAFRGWIDRLEELRVPLFNPAAVLRWNMDKRYLLDLEARGVKVVATAWVEQGEGEDLAALLARRGWSAAVFKRALGAGGYQTFRCRPGEAAALQPEFARLQRAGAVMVQPYLAQIETAGEWSFIFFAGRFSHAVRKLPGAGGFLVQQQHGGSERAAPAPAHLLEDAARALAAAGGPTLYGRVDGVELDGGLLLMELELLEPSLFFSEDPGAAGRFAAALAQALSPFK